VKENQSLSLNTKPKQEKRTKKLERDQRTKKKGQSVHKDEEDDDADVHQLLGAAFI